MPPNYESRTGAPPGKQDRRPAGKAGPAPRRERPAPRGEAVFFPGGAPVPHKQNAPISHMTPWKLLDSAPVPGNGGELRLYQRGDEFSIKLSGRGELMSSRVHGSEDALAEQTCARLTESIAPRLLIGGLGMGFTLAAALRHIGVQGRVEVAELVPAVVEWNRGLLGEAAGYPLRDPRVTVHAGDVARVLRAGQSVYDAILLDVDNGPEGLTRKENDWLYGMDGLNASSASLRPGGVLAVWSAGPDQDFLQRLRKVGFEVDEVRVRTRGSKGARHVIWFARRG
jgi:spermidine synthase